MHFLSNWLSTEYGWKGERGQTLVEYGLILVFVSVALIGTLIILEGSVSGYYQEISEAVEAVV